MPRYGKKGVPRHRTLASSTADRLERSIEKTDRQAGQKMIRQEIKDQEEKE